MNVNADEWPVERGLNGGVQWLHSDFKDVSYLYTHKVFDHMVLEGLMR